MSTREPFARHFDRQGDPGLFTAIALMLLAARVLGRPYAPVQIADAPDAKNIKTTEVAYLLATIFDRAAVDRKRDCTAVHEWLKINA